MTAGSTDGTAGGAGAGPDTINAFELAALVFEDGVSVDHLMTYFAGELRMRGVAIGGIVQLPPETDRPEDAPQEAPMKVLDLMTGEAITIKQRLGKGSKACSLDTQAMAEAAARIRQAVAARVDLLFISRFSKQEVLGQGFRAEFGLAVESGIPLLTSVKRPSVPDWLTFTGGIGTLLACRLKVLDDWWMETDTRRRRILARERQMNSVALPGVAEARPSAEIIPLFEVWR